MPSPTDILMPNGALIGSPGSDLTIREVPGGAAAAQQMFDELSVGGKENTPPGYPGTMVELPQGTRVGLRPSSKSGPPTIDVNFPNVPIRKVKFL